MISWAPTPRLLSPGPGPRSQWAGLGPGDGFVGTPYTSQLPEDAVSRLWGAGSRGLWG